MQPDVCELHRERLRWAGLGVGYSLAVHDYQTEGPWNVDHSTLAGLCSPQGHLLKLSIHADLDSPYQNKVPSSASSLPSSRASAIVQHITGFFNN